MKKGVYFFRGSEIEILGTATKKDGYGRGFRIIKVSSTQTIIVHKSLLDNFMRVK